MLCATDMAARQHACDEADAAIYSEEVERRALQFMAPGGACDPNLPANIATARDDLDDQALPADAVDAFWYDRAEFMAIAEMSRTPKKYRNRY